MTTARAAIQHLLYHAMLDSISEKLPKQVIIGDEFFEYRGGKLWLYEHKKYFRKAMGEDIKPEGGQ
jgi:hypothetical protein